jgi:hypothetical protein
MKKILTTLTVIAATALGAQGQFTNTNYISGTGTTPLSGLGFTGGTADPNLDFSKAQLLFRVQGFNFASTNSSIVLSGITLTGQGITGSFSFDPVTITSNSLTSYGFSTTFQDFNTNVAIWDPALNSAAFTVEFKNGASAQSFGPQLFYRLRYSNEDGENINRDGGVNIVAVPEPSAYAAAAGLLALFLWSSRRHLFKLAGARSSASGSGENGAA